MTISTIQIACSALTEAGAQAHASKSTCADTDARTRETGFGDALSEEAGSEIAQFKALSPDREGAGFGFESEASSDRIFWDKSGTSSLNVPTDPHPQSVILRTSEFAAVSDDQIPTTESAKIADTAWGPHALLSNAAQTPLIADSGEIPEVISQTPTGLNVGGEPDSGLLNAQKQYSIIASKITPELSNGAPIAQVSNSNATAIATVPAVLSGSQPTENNQASATDLDVAQNPLNEGKATEEQARANSLDPTFARTHCSQPSKVESVFEKNRPVAQPAVEQLQTPNLIPTALGGTSEIAENPPKPVHSDHPPPALPRSEVLVTSTSAMPGNKPKSAPTPTSVFNPLEATEQLRMLPRHDLEITGGITPFTNTGSPASTNAVLSAPAQLPTQLPQHISTQICNALETSVNQDIEIRLDPEELGRVRIVLSPRETGMNVVVFSDRPEVLDLMRRNSDMLEADFSDIGYESSNFSFEQEHDDKPTPTQNANQHLDIEMTTDLPISQQTTGDTTRLDLRM
ncbi:flagellar hook-length control protein FliK [Litoreibacter meonggei]|uniref:Flagellar hook-length control protein FliK n=1 Tax=Litoreibacter meonggei TaxID=1049199 RepID=A0A497VD36_9RHOB|nr:flagellar hook-length control protein FliK [Litoreibacter meonggei]RLJ41202.1 flagellar hook-length control protein FliK [Litoreibacter meonggei]